MKRRSFLQFFGLAPAAPIAAMAASKIAEAAESMPKPAPEAVPLFTSKRQEVNEAYYDIVTCSSVTSISWNTPPVWRK